MFATVAAEIADRHLASQRTVALIKALEEGKSQAALAAACKGLAFVQLYATYEYSVRSAVRATLGALRAADVEIRTLRRSLIALVLKSDWDSVSDSSRSRVWNRRMALIANVYSDTHTSTLMDDIFPSDGSHFRQNQLRTIWKLFSISGPVVSENRLIGRIDELVENRNAISHGRRTPEEVGSRYSWQDIASCVNDTEAIASHIVSSLELHVQSGGLFAPRVSFDLVLHPTYYRKGFFNVGVARQGEFGANREKIELFLDGRTGPLIGKINRTANTNGTPRIMGGTGLRDWFQSRAREMDSIQIDVVSPSAIRLKAIPRQPLAEDRC